MAMLAGPGTANPLVGDLRRSGLVTLLVLHFVADEACYGNQLIERITELTTGAIAVNPNTMYPLLRSLQERGLIEGAWEHPDRRTRRYYRITPAGDAERRQLASALQPNLETIMTTIGLIQKELGSS
jgi:DNA-binding PadR family transcriptional regulator